MVLFNVQKKMHDMSNLSEDSMCLCLFVLEFYQVNTAWLDLSDRLMICGAFRLLCYRSQL